jgi:hypothetical protein
MQDLINLSLADLQRDERAWEMAKVNREGWKRVRERNGREAVARVLVALAARIAPAVAPPTPSTPARTHALTP